jgi:hypothetical protein
VCENGRKKFSWALKVSLSLGEASKRWKKGERQKWLMKGLKNLSLASACFERSFHEDSFHKIHAHMSVRV